ncbi:Ccr4-associated factor [Melia azedarach]|uniref:Ccr4-associated factor n=1 Tax=Melia azedarach TaxID=155640 RepID=A0ACC1Y6Z0_MELAZ|nr:Ccr4-associated factor [Melia azedarach]
MKVIQLGMTLSDSNGNICSTWEFNFSDFDLKKDPHVESSIDLLRSNGLDFEKVKRDGIEGRVFVGKFLEILPRHRNLKWVTFHGLYDLAYMLKLLSGNPLPGSVFGFVKLTSGYFEYVYDIKFMARFCDGLMGGELGLNRAAKILNLERSGAAHNAGSDCNQFSKTGPDIFYPASCTTTENSIPGNFRGLCSGTNLAAIAKAIEGLA